MGPQPHGHGYVVGYEVDFDLHEVSMGPQPHGHGYSTQMQDFVICSLSFDESASILRLHSSVALRFPSPFAHLTPDLARGCFSKGISEKLSAILEQELVSEAYL